MCVRRQAADGKEGVFVFFFFFPADDGMRDAQESRRRRNVSTSQHTHTHTHTHARTHTHTHTHAHAHTRTHRQHTSYAVDSPRCIETGGPPLMQKKQTDYTHQSNHHPTPTITDTSRPLQPRQMRQSEYSEVTHT